MSFLLDTDTCSAHIKGAPSVSSRVLQYAGRLHISLVTEAELKQWLFRRRTPPRYVHEFNYLLPQLTVLTLDQAIVDEFARIGASLLDQGSPMATPDLLIAATALVHGLTLVTHNTQDYVLVPGLALADWLIP